MKLGLEHRSRPQGLPDLLLYDTLIDDGVCLLQDGALLAAWKFRGPDMQSATHAEMMALSARLNAILRFGSGWMVQVDAIRSAAPGYPDRGAFPDPITRLIDDERRQQFMFERAHFESEYFLSLTYLPPYQQEEKLRGWLYEGRKVQREPAVAALDYFNSAVRGFHDVFSSLFQVTRLRATQGAGPDICDDLLRFIRQCVCADDYPFALPEVPVYLNELVSTEDFVGGIEPKIGKRHIRVIAVDGFPRLSYPGILGALDTLPAEYRWNTRAILLDPTESQSMLDKTRKKWRSKVRGFKDQLFRTETGPVNIFAHEMAIDAEEAMGVAASGDVHFSLFSSNIICYDTDAKRLEDNVSAVNKTIQNLGFGCRIETVNAIEAWRGTLPGDGYRNVRRVMLHTLNVADLMPITAVWAGEKMCPSALMPRNAPPVLFAATTGATPFRFNLHSGDVGHTMMIGPPGAGKSTLLALIAAQWFRYPRAQVFAFDKGYSLYVLAKAAGGEFYDVAGEMTDLAFCPLREIDSDADLAWAVDWLESLCTLQGFTVTPRERNALTYAVKLLRQSPKRTLTELCANVQDTGIRDALQYYTLAGPMGILLDAEEDMLGDGRFVVFETENLMQLGDKAVVAVLLYLFRRIKKRLDGSPTLVPLDEAWIYLRHPLFRERIREWLKTLRKYNGAVLLATQNLSDIFNSPTKDVVLESCPTKILLPNAEAGNPASRAFYDQIGLNQREIEIVQKSIPKRQYYVVSPAGRRLIALGMGGVALSFLGVSGKEERSAAEDIMKRYGDAWQPEWLRLRGLPDWAAYYEELKSITGRMIA